MGDYSLWFALGRPLAPLYGAAMRLREWGYGHGLLRTTRMETLVISVGNLTLGGTGKTPVVHYLARLLQERGWRPAIISRGYGGATRKPVNVVSDGEQLYLHARAVGDEPRLLAETLPGVPVLTGVVRRLPAREAVGLGADILLLDDGFQHLAMARDLDLVLFHADILAGNSRVFPGGVLREPVKALNRCHAFVLTNTGSANQDRAYRFGELLQRRFPGRPVFYTGYRATSLVVLTDGTLQQTDLAGLQGQRWLAFAGTAHPENFLRTLKDLGVDLAGFQAFGDHFAYTEDHLHKLAAQARQAGADGLLTTEKDLVKLRDCAAGLPVLALRMQVQADPGFDRFVLERLRTARARVVPGAG